MPQKILAFIRHNAIALLALFVALGGTSYAALTINGSQIRNRSLDSVKLDPKSIAGSIKAWVHLGGDGSHALLVYGASSPVRVAPNAVGGESVTWLRRRFSQSCGAMVTPEATVPHPVTPTLPVSFDRRAGTVAIFTSGGTESAFVAVVCP